MTTKTLTLRKLTIDDELAFWAGLKEWQGEELDWYTFVWREGMSYPEMLEALNKAENGIDLVPGHVPCTMFYGFVDSEIVGRVNIRHALTESLTVRGGHVGYAVAPKFRGQGYATQMLKQALPLAKHLGIKSALLTCREDNIASWKIIESCSGKLENTIWDEKDQTNIRRYWMPL